MSEDIFCLDNNEEYIERCGEIFRTNMDEIIIHCTMCEDKFRGFNAYLIHLNKEHCSSSFESLDVETIEQEEMQEKNLTIFQQELTDKNMQGMFDLNFLDDCLMNMEEEMLNEFIQMIPETPQTIDKAMQTVPETPTQNDTNINIVLEMPKANELSTLPDPTIETLSEVRQVRKCNIQNSIELRPHKCPACGLGFQDKGNMIHHMKRHSTERNHECPECGKKFYTGYELRIHSKIHTRELPFQCRSCTQSFRTKSRLLVHEKKHINQRDFKCSECEKAFFEKRILQEHMETHKTNRQFICSVCNAVFKVKKSLVRHEKIHAHQKTLFKCTECRAVYVQKRGLNLHMEKKHQDF